MRGLPEKGPVYVQSVCVPEEQMDDEEKKEDYEEGTVEEDNKKEKKPKTKTVEKTT